MAKNNKQAAVQPQKIAVSTPAQASTLFNEFRKNSGAQPITVKGSKAKYYSAHQVTEYFAQQGKIINLGWFARALHAAANSGMKISTNTVDLGDKQITVYRAS
jgi:hypothetical protein